MRDIVVQETIEDIDKVKGLQNSSKMLYKTIPYPPLEKLFPTLP